MSSLQPKGDLVGLAIWVCIISSFVSFVASCILLPSGAGRLVDPSQDFTRLGGTCNITEVIHSVELGHKGYDCWDVYRYRFLYQGEGKSYLSREERSFSHETHFSVNNGRCEEEPKQPGSFRMGQETPCWLGKAEVDRLRNMYKCEIESAELCLKIFDPAEEEGARTGPIMIAVGASLLALALGLLLVVLWLGRIRKTRVSDQVSQEVSNEMSNEVSNEKPSEQAEA